MRKSAYPLAFLMTAMLLIALTRMPYGYYMLLKVVTCAIFIGYATHLRSAANPMLYVSAWLLALMYNPLIPFHLGRQTWSVVNIATIVIAWLIARVIRSASAEDDARDA